jgi:hypothetical protein
VGLPGRLRRGRRRPRARVRAEPPLREQHNLIIRLLGTANAHPFLGFAPGELSIVGGKTTGPEGRVILNVDRTPLLVTLDPGGQYSLLADQPFARNRSEWPAEADQVEYRLVGFATAPRSEALVLNWPGELDFASAVNDLRHRVAKSLGVPAHLITGEPESPSPDSPLVVSAQ